MLDESNPYAAPACDPVMPVATQAIFYKRQLLAASLYCILGTSLAGGLFGIIGCLLGVIVGFCLATVVGIPVTIFVFAIFALVSPGRIPRSRVIRMAALCGAMTGFICCSPLLAGLAPVSLVLSGVAAGLGAAGAAFAVFLLCQVAYEPEPPAIWRDPE